MSAIRYGLIGLIMFVALGCASVVVVESDAVKSFNKAATKMVGLCPCGTDCKCMKCDGKCPLEKVKK